MQSVAEIEALIAKCRERLDERPDNHPERPNIIKQIQELMLILDAKKEKK